MSSINLIYYGADGEAAKRLAADLRSRKMSAGVRHAVMFDGVEKCASVTIMPDVDAFDAARLQAAYGDRVKGAAKAKKDDGDDLIMLRAEYERKFGKKPFGGWKPDTLRAKIAEAE